MKIKPVPVGEPRVRRVAEPPGCRRTTLLRRMRAEVERLPAMGKPLNRPSNPSNTGDNQP